MTVNIQLDVNKSAPATTQRVRPAGNCQEGKKGKGMEKKRHEQRNRKQAVLGGHMRRDATK